MLVWFVLKPLGILSLILGAITLPTPVPVGGILIAFGLALLVMTSSTARGIVRRLRTASGSVDGLIARVEGRFARRLRVPLRRTRPLARRLRAPAPPPAA